MQSCFKQYSRAWNRLSCTNFWKSSDVSVCCCRMKTSPWDGGGTLLIEASMFKHSIRASCSKKKTPACFAGQYFEQNKREFWTSKLVNRCHSYKWQFLQTVVEFVNKCESLGVVTSVFLQHAFNKMLTKCSYNACHFLLGYWIWWVCRIQHPCTIYHAGVLLIHPNVLQSMNPLAMSSASLAAIQVLWVGKTCLVVIVCSTEL